jgi:hypothetical protein
MNVGVEASGGVGDPAADAAREPARWATPVVVCVVASLAGALFGAATNVINGRVSADYFAIVMSWDGQTAAVRAIVQGLFEGWAAGLLLGFFFCVVIAASTRLRCPPPLALRTLAIAPATAAAGWVIGGAIGVTLALLWPQLWGFFFVGVPPRVNLPRFAWVGGSIWGAYAGAVIGLVIASVTLHRRWQRTHGRTQGFGVLPPTAQPLPSLRRF